MQRHYFLDDELDDLEKVSAELQQAGIAGEQVYVLTESEHEVEGRDFNHVWSILKQDTVHSAIIGSVIGVFLAVLVLVGAWASGLPESYTWVPFVFLAIVVLGFCTWEGGLWGIQQPHHEFKRFRTDLEHGRHLLLVEVDGAETETMNNVVSSHATLTRVGEGTPVPRFVRLGHIIFNRYREFGP